MVAGAVFAFVVLPALIDTGVLIGASGPNDGRQRGQRGEVLSDAGVVRDVEDRSATHHGAARSRDAPGRAGTPASGR